MKWLNYHHLFYFKEIAVSGSIANASRNLNLGAPALSTQLKQLEENFGAKLFTRTKKSLVLTEEGLVVLKYANEIFKIGEELLQVFNDQSFGHKAHYNIGALDLIPKTIICDLIAETKTQGDDCSITVLEESLSVLIGKLMSHELDILLTNSDMSTMYDVQSKLVGKCKIGVFGHKKYAKIAKNFPHSLNGIDVILPTSHSKLRFDIDHYFRNNQMKYNLITECQDSAVKKILASTGEGVIFLPLNLEGHLKKYHQLTKLGSIDELTETFWLNYPKSMISNKITDGILKHFSILAD